LAALVWKAEAGSGLTGAAQGAKVKVLSGTLAPLTSCEPLAPRVAAAADRLHVTPMAVRTTRALARAGQVGSGLTRALRAWVW
jgi:hypothetical protein